MNDRIWNALMGALDWIEYHCPDAESTVRAYKQCGLDYNDLIDLAGFTEWDLDDIGITKEAYDEM